MLLTAAALLLSLGIAGSDVRGKSTVDWPLWYKQRTSGRRCAGAGNPVGRQDKRPLCNLGTLVPEGLDRLWLCSLQCCAPERGSTLLQSMRFM